MFYWRGWKGLQPSKSITAPGGRRSLGAGNCDGTMFYWRGCKGLQPRVNNGYRSLERDLGAFAHSVPRTRMSNPHPYEIQFSFERP